MRHDGRTNDQLRPITITRGFTATPAGSVLWKQGETIMLCTASVTQDLPPWMPDSRPGGWVTAEYVMLPGSTPQRKPWPRSGHTDSRGTEIQRLIGRALRAVVDLSKIGPHTIALDCQVLQADGGTRTAAICGGFVALADAIDTLPADLPNPQDGPTAPRYDRSYYDPSKALVDELSAVSVGIVDNEVRLDLAYYDDSRANVDMNLAATASGKIVEIQAAAENGEGFPVEGLQEMLTLGLDGCRQLIDIQRKARAS